MKHFKEFIQWCCEPQRLFVLFIVVLAIPNVALFFTEQQMTLWARICNVILPVSVYWLIMTLGRFLCGIPTGIAIPVRAFYHCSRYVPESDNY